MQGHTAVKRWTRKVDIFTFDILLVPVHLGFHWCLAVVDFAQSAVFYYDSMGGNNWACLEALGEYLTDEYMHKKKRELSTDHFNMEFVKVIPRQKNGSDCGVFALQFAEHISRRAAINFDQADIPYFRRRMVYEIINKKIV